jgi:hypothetical protein
VNRLGDNIDNYPKLYNTGRWFIATVFQLFFGICL